MVVDLTAIHPQLGIGVGRPRNAAKRIFFGRVSSLKWQHSSGNLISTSDSVVIKV